MADLDAYLHRLVDLANDLLAGNGLAGSEFPDELEGHLPFIFIREGAATYQVVNRDTVRITREYSANLYARAFKDDNITEELAARAVARPYLTSYPGYFLARNKLQRADAGLSGLVNATISNDGSISSASRKLLTYSGIDFRHLLTYEDAIERI